MRCATPSLLTFIISFTSLTSTNILAHPLPTSHSSKPTSLVRRSPLPLSQGDGGDGVLRTITTDNRPSLDGDGGLKTTTAERKPVLNGDGSYTTATSTNNKPSLNGNGVGGGRSTAIVPYNSNPKGLHSNLNILNRPPRNLREYFRQIGAKPEKQPGGIDLNGYGKGISITDSSTGLDGPIDRDHWADHPTDRRKIKNPPRNLRELFILAKIKPEKRPRPFRGDPKSMFSYDGPKMKSAQGSGRYKPVDFDERMKFCMRYYEKGCDHSHEAYSRSCKRYAYHKTHLIKEPYGPGVFDPLAPGQSPSEKKRARRKRPSISMEEAARKQREQADIPMPGSMRDDVNGRKTADVKSQHLVAGDRISLENKVADGVEQVKDMAQSTMKWIQSGEAKGWVDDVARSAAAHAGASMQAGKNVVRPATVPGLPIRVMG